MAEPFYLKYRDTIPIFEVVLLNPDGTVHDLTGAQTYTLHVQLADGTKIAKAMTLEGSPTNGTVRYQWVAADWTAGGLVPGTHRLEYEVVAGLYRVTFPNYGYDLLVVSGDIGQT